MSILAQIIGLACLLFWGFWLCCKLRLPAVPRLTAAPAVVAGAADRVGVLNAAPVGLASNARVPLGWVR